MPNPFVDPFVDAANTTYTLAHATDPGRSGKNNEDNYALFTSIQRLKDGSDLPVQVAIVADGIGGSASGELASQLAIDTFVETFKQNITLNVHDRLALAIHSTNQAIFAAALAQPETKGMGTTLVAAILLNDVLYLAHAGDSRAYLIRNGQIYLLTLDHSWVQEAIDAKLITVQQARRHFNRNVIKRFLGPQERVEVDQRILEVADRQHDGREPQNRRYAEGDRLRLLSGDTLLLCSDGLNDAIPDHEILHIVLQHRPPQAVHELIRAANAAGGPDNITALLLQPPPQLFPSDGDTTLVTLSDESADITENWQLVPAAASSNSQTLVVKRKIGFPMLLILIVGILILIGAAMMVWGNSFVAQLWTT